jgi:transketolase
MSALPNIVVTAPADPVEARAITKTLAGSAGPAYLRLGKAGELVLHAENDAVEFGRAILFSDGADLTLISTGGMLATTLRAAEALGTQGNSVRVLSMPYLVPLDEEAIRDACHQTGGILTIEEHGYGGLGTMVGEYIARSGHGIPFRPLRLGRSPIRVAGSQEQLRTAQGLSAEGIVQEAAALCRLKPAR